MSIDLITNSVLPLVVYVEDEVLLQICIEFTFQDAGFELIAVSDGESALSLLSQRRGDVRALITDIDLGRGISGWIAARHARALIPNLPVVYVSGASSGQWSVEGVCGSVMISKPFAPEEVVAAVSLMLMDVSLKPSSTSDSNEAAQLNYGS